MVKTCKGTGKSVMLKLYVQEFDLNGYIEKQLGDAVVQIIFVWTSSSGIWLQEADKVSSYVCSFW